MLIISDHQQSSETQSIFRCLIEVMWRMCQTGSCTVNFDLDFPFTSIINIKNHINNLQVKREVGINITLYTSNVWLGGGFTILFFLEAQPNYLFVYVSLTQSGHFLNPFACVTYSLVNDEILPSPLTIVFSCNLISFIFLLTSSIHSSTS